MHAVCFKAGSLFVTPMLYLVVLELMELLLVAARVHLLPLVVLQYVMNRLVEDLVILIVPVKGKMYFVQWVDNSRFAILQHKYLVVL